MIDNLIIKKQSGNEKLFFSFFAIVIIMKCLNISDISDYVPYSYAYLTYIIIWGGLAFFSAKGKLKKHFKPSTILLISLGCYYLVFGLHNIYNIDFDDASGNLIRSILLVFFIGVTCYWIKRYDCLYRFIKLLYYVFSIYIIVWILLSLTSIDVLRTLSTFFSFDNNIRYRNYLGFSYPNIGGEMAVCAIVFSKILLKYEKKKSLSVRTINIVMFFAVIINNSRGSLLALIVFELMNFYLENKSSTKAVKKTSRYIALAVLALLLVLFYLIFVKGLTLFEILQGTNRQAALMENIILLRNSGQWLMGIGRLTGGFFAEKNIVYGTQTGYLEVFYFDVFITTGIIGSICMAALILYLLKKIISAYMNAKSYLGRWIFCVFIYMMFVSLFETYMFSYVYASSMCLIIIIFSFIDLYSKGIGIKDNQKNIARGLAVNS